MTEIRAAAPPSAGEDNTELRSLSTLHSDLERVAVVEDPEGIDEATQLELEFLTALAWAPQHITTATVHAIIGTVADRANPNADRIPLSAALFVSESHRAVFAEIAGMVGEAVPVTPTLLQARINTTRTMRQELKGVLLDIAAPADRAPMPGGVDAPHLAAATVNAWYRRGYNALLARMSTVAQTESADDLAAHWTALTHHQRLAERRWLAVRDALARIA